MVALSLRAHFGVLLAYQLRQGADADVRDVRRLLAVVVHFGYWACVVACVILGLLIGGLTERLLVRGLYGKPEIKSIVVMVGFLIVLEAVARGNLVVVPREVCRLHSHSGWQLAGKPLALSPFTVYEIVTALIVYDRRRRGCRFTKLGLQLRASAVAPEVSRLLGVRVGRLLTLGWMLSTVVGVITTDPRRIKPLSGTDTDGNGRHFAYGFIAAAIGGLESPVGAIGGGRLARHHQSIRDRLRNQNAVIIIALVFAHRLTHDSPERCLQRSDQRGASE